MNEIKEIMNGNIKIFNMRIEGETIGFDTPYNSNWNFMPRDFEQIIDTLQQENARLKDKIEKATNFVDKYMDEWDFQDEVRKDMNDLLILLKEN